MGDVGVGLVAGQQPEGGAMGEALGHGGLLGPGEQGREGWLAGEDEGDDQAAIHVEVGEEAEHGQRLGPQVLGLVEEEDGPEPIGGGGMLEGVLELAHQGGIDAGGREAAGDGDLLAEVAFAEPRDLDVADAVAGLGEAGTEDAERDGLATAGGGDEGGTPALVDGLCEGFDGLVLVGDREALGHVQLTSEGGRAEAHGAQVEVHSWFSRAWW